MANYDAANFSFKEVWLQRSFKVYIRPYYGEFVLFTSNRITTLTYILMENF